MTDQAITDGLDDEPERVTPEVVDVDTSAAKPDVDEQPEPGEVVHLPVRQEVVPDLNMGTLIPLREELRGVAELAVTLAMATTLPKALQGKPADVLAVILTGRELGVAPMTALRTFHVIQGQVTLAPKVRMAMVRQQGLGKIWPDPDNDDDVATWYAERADQPGIVFRATYTTAMAGAVTFTEWVKTANGSKAVEKNLLDKDNWKNYPAQMCQWRALGYLLDQAFPEVGCGLYSADELGAVTDDEGHPILDVESTEALVPQQGGSRKAKKPAPTDPEANPATIESLQKRIEKIKTYPDALAKLTELWKAPDDDGQPKLPPLRQLLHRQERTASALVDLIERQIAKGESGDPQTTAEPTAEPTPDATQEVTSKPESAAEAPAGPDVPPEAPTATQEPAQGALLDAPLDVTGLPEGRSAKDDLKWVAKAPVPMVTKCGETVKAMSTAEVLAALEAEDLPTTGNAATCSQRLAMRRIRQMMEQAAAVSDG